MAPEPLLLPILSLLLILSAANAASDSGSGGLHPGNETQEWAQLLHLEEEEDESEERRSLYGWQPKKRYYISYGALSANRVPCPPRSGRSYYTHDCFKSRGAVHPYTRGCSAITRCRR